MKLAPIVLFVYNRPWHTQQTLEALMNNTLAKESVLYIYADGPKKDLEEKQLEQIKEVRRLIRTRQWCKEIHIIEFEENHGLAASIREGVTEVLERHGRVIVIEDDLRTSPAFLSYMNRALSFYENRSVVFSVSAFCLPPNKLKIPEDYPYDVFTCLRNSSWGWGTWIDRWRQVDWELTAYDSISTNSDIKLALDRLGDDVYRLLEMRLSGVLDIWSIQFTITHFINHAISIVPTKSYVDNLGNDGSGENCGVHPDLRNDRLSLNENPRFLEILYEDSRIINAFYNAYCCQKRPIWKKLINRICRILGQSNRFVIKKKIYN